MPNIKPVTDLRNYTNSQSNVYFVVFAPLARRRFYLRLRGGEQKPPCLRLISNWYYNEVLRDVSAGEPVFLTRNGRGRYALVDIVDYEKTQATIKLMSQLAEGEKAGHEKGWLTIEEVEKSLSY